MWEAIKAICGVVVFIGLVLAVASTFFIFSWILKIIGFILAVVLVLAFLMYVIWEILAGWWQDR